MNNKLWNRTFLKYVAAIAMLIDHIGMMFLPVSTVPGCLCRVIGRLTAPIMCLFIAEGYAYTSSRKKYGLRLFIFALISQVPYSLAHYNEWFRFEMNMIFTLFLSYLMLLAYERVPGNYRRWLVVGAIIGASSVGDWGIFGPLFVLNFYIFRGDRKAQAKNYAVISAAMVIMEVAFCIVNDYHWYGELWQLGLYLFLPVIFLYNGEPGSRHPFHKWFFYLWYPAHFLLLWWIKYHM